MENENNTLTFMVSFERLEDALWLLEAAFDNERLLDLECSRKQVMTSTSFQDLNPKWCLNTAREMKNGRLNYEQR